jgi:hypothetical protein
MVKYHTNYMYRYYLLVLLVSWVTRRYYYHFSTGKKIMVHIIYFAYPITWNNSGYERQLDSHTNVDHSSIYTI